MSRSSVRTRQVAPLMSNTHELQLHETDDGELYFEIPEDVIQRLNWGEGDELQFNICENNGFMITKVAQSDD